MTPPGTTAHTPGPWFTDHRHEVCALLDGITCVVIAEANPMAELNDETAAANARLIAAAPAMREALEKIAANEVEVYDEDIRATVVVSMDGDEAAEIARAALRLALPQGDGGEGHG